MTPGSFGGGGLGWAMTFISAFLLVSVVVDLLRGEGFQTTSAALGVMLLPQGVQQIAASRSHQPLAERARTASSMALPLAAVLVWAGLISTWRAGEENSWLLVVGAVLLLVAALVAVAGAVAGRRSGQAGTSERMNA